MVDDNHRAPGFDDSLNNQGSLIEEDLVEVNQSFLQIPKKIINPCGYSFLIINLICKLVIIFFLLANFISKFRVEVENSKDSSSRRNNYTLLYEVFIWISNITGIIALLLEVVASGYLRIKIWRDPTNNNASIIYFKYFFCLFPILHFLIKESILYGNTDSNTIGVFYKFDIDDLELANIYIVAFIMNSNIYLPMFITTCVMGCVLGIIAWQRLKFDMSLATFDNNEINSIKRVKTLNFDFGFESSKKHLFFLYLIAFLPFTEGLFTYLYCLIYSQREFLIVYYTIEFASNFLWYYFYSSYRLMNH